MTEYKPDHNGECLHCDEPLDAHHGPTFICPEHCPKCGSLDLYVDARTTWKEVCCRECGAYVRPFDSV
jgi:hypothetical protein